MKTQKQIDYLSARRAKFADRACVRWLTACEEFGDKSPAAVRTKAAYRAAERLYLLTINMEPRA